MNGDADDLSETPFSSADEADDDIAELSALLVAAQSGRRSDVQDLVDAAEELTVFLPLSEAIQGAEEGVDFEVHDDLALRPHMLLDTDEQPYAVAYSDPALAADLVEELEWKTGGDDLQFVRVPLQVAFEISQEQVEGKAIRGLVFNPSTPAELVLSRDEASHLLQGKAIPLVGYVAELEEDDEGTLVLEDADPPPPALLAALAAEVEAIAELSGFTVKTTFNPERDREPHLTITLEVPPGDVDRGAVAERVMAEATRHLPAPGYADVVFSVVP